LRKIIAVTGHKRKKKLDQYFIRAS